MTLSKMRIIMSLFLIFLLEISYSQNKYSNHGELEVNEFRNEEVSTSSKNYRLQEKTAAEQQTGKKRKTVFVRSSLSPFEGKDISKESPPQHTVPKKEKETGNGKNTVFVKGRLVPFEEEDIHEVIQPRKASPEKDKDESKKGSKTVFIEATLTPTD